VYCCQVDIRRDKQRLNVLVHRVLRETFGGVTELNDWHISLDCTRRSNEIGWACGTDEGEDKFIEGFGGKCLIEWTNGGPGNRQEYNIQMDGIERCRVDSSGSE